MKEKSSGMGSDLNRVDSHVIQPEEYEELPELTDELLAKADLYEGIQPVRRSKTLEHRTGITLTQR